jgi:hypothetical protein
MRMLLHTILAQLVLVFILCMSASAIEVTVTQLTRPLVWSNMYFDINIPQLLHAGLVCVSDSNCRMYELNSQGTVRNPFYSKSETEVVHQFAALPQFVTRYEPQVIEVSSSETDLWKNLKSAVGKITYAYSPLDRNCFAFTENILAFFNVTTSGQHYASRFRQAFDLDLSPFHIKERASELVALDLGVHNDEHTKARLYLKTNKITKRGNLLRS